MSLYRRAPPTSLPRHFLPCFPRHTPSPLARTSALASSLSSRTAVRSYARTPDAYIVRSFIGCEHQTARMLVARTICSYARHPITHLFEAGPSEHCPLSARLPDDVLLLFARPVQFSLARSLADLLLVSLDYAAWLFRTCSAWLCCPGLVRTRTDSFGLVLVHRTLLLGLLWASDSLCCCCCCCWACREHWMESRCYTGLILFSSSKTCKCESFLRNHIPMSCLVLVSRRFPSSDHFTCCT